MYPLAYSRGYRFDSSPMCFLLIADGRERKESTNESAVLQSRSLCMCHLWEGRWNKPEALMQTWTCPPRSFRCATTPSRPIFPNIETGFPRVTC